MEQKRCNKCGINKPLNEFYPRKDSKDGYRNDCIACFIERSHKNHLSYQEHSKGRVPSQPRRNFSQEYFEAHKEEILGREEKYKEARQEVTSERRVTRHQVIIENREAYQAKHPKIQWVINAVGHHQLIGNKIRQDILAMAEGTTHCPICHCKLKYPGGVNLLDSASLDRKNNDSSKNIDHFWIICLNCNKTKLDRNMQAMDEWCKQWQNARVNKADYIIIRPDQNEGDDAN
jgi:hypothetical protein